MASTIRAANSTATAICASGTRPKTASSSSARTDCEVNEYGSFESVPGAKLNGKLTLGENTADNGGLRIAYQALMSTLASEGSERGQADRRLHAVAALLHLVCPGMVPEPDRPDRARAGQDRSALARPMAREWLVQNFDEFGKAFGCKKGQPMMPDNACRVW